MSIFSDTSKERSSHSDRSAGDRARHRLKVREAIRKNIGDIVAEESLIGGKGGKIIKVPIQGIKEYSFIYGENIPGVGSGDGQSKPGDVVSHGQQPGDQGGPGGNRPGTDYYETEITLEELTEILFEDLELPDQERQNLRKLPTLSRRKISGYRKKGILARLSRPRSARERVKRLQEIIHSLHNREEELKNMYDQLKDFLTQSQKIVEALRASGQFAEADRKQKELEKAGQEKQAEINLAHQQLADLYKLQSVLGQKGKLTAEPSAEKKRFPFRQDDLRFKHRRDKPHEESNAVVICIMDTSGSMDTMKKYLARSFFFLLHRFVTTKYTNVELVFIAHDTEAKEVTQEEFFHKGESGGTMISSGYRKALEIIHDRYDPSLWNIYGFHCSDGDNFSSDNEETLRATEEICKIARLFGYGEIKPQKGLNWSSMSDVLKPVEQNYPNFTIVRIANKEDLWDRFKQLLSKAKDQEE